MWAYRLDKAPNLLGMTITTHAMREKLKFLNIDYGSSSTVLENFDRDFSIAKSMAHSLGWDTTASSMVCYLVPAVREFAYGFVITQATSAQRFVVSPVPLPYLEEGVDWDAHTSVDEVTSAIGALDGTHTKPAIQIGEWKKSHKGNMYCFINGAQFTTFPDREGSGFKGIISQGNDKVFTQSFKTEQACADYVFKNFYALVKHWTPTEAEANPFSGVDWSAGEDDDERRPALDDDIPF